MGYSTPFEHVPAGIRHDDDGRAAPTEQPGRRRGAEASDAQRGQADLSEGHFGVLSVLHKHGEMSPGALADHERTRPPSMTRAVNALAGLGLVEKIEHATDRRQVVVRLTEAGAREVAETRRRRDAWLTQQLSQLTPDERQTLARAADLLNRIAAR